ncbi:MAG: VOC family protein [Acidimicrobiia bacterium]|nr:VOC family protein [Acidimicrobiia bacterium]
MTPTMQVAIDAAEPHAQNRFWAAIMEYEIEDHHDMIEQIVAAGHAGEDDIIEVEGRKVWKTAAASRPRDGSGARLLFQHVPEAKAVKNRVHLDLHVGDDERDGAVARALELGATKLWDGRQGPQTWVTLADPEGNEFCIS